MIGLNQVNYRKVELPSAVTDLASLLQLLNDKKLFEKHLAELVKLTDEANEAISNVGKAKEINNLLTEAEQLNKIAKDKASSANELATATTTKAENEAKKLISEAQAKASQLLKNAETKLEDAKNDWNDALSNKAANESLRLELDSLAESLRKREAAIEKAESNIAEKKKLLAQL